MNTGQMLLVLGAALLFSTAAITIGDVLLTSDRVAIESQAGTLAISIARETIADQLAVPFDLLLIGGTAESINTPFATFVCSTRVDYVNDSSPDTPVGGPTSFKRVWVSVESNYQPGPLTLVAVSCDL